MTKVSVLCLVYFLISLSFRTNHEIGSNSQAPTLIHLKLGHPEEIISINFGENPCKILRVIIDHLHKTKTIFRHAYRVNYLLDQPENWCIARFNIREVIFGG